MITKVIHVGPPGDYLDFVTLLQFPSKQVKQKGFFSAILGLQIEHLFRTAKQRPG